VSAWLSYSLARIGIFAVVFALLYFVGITWWASAIFATVVSFTVAYIFLAKLRHEMAQSVQTRLNKPKPSPADEDAAAEDHA
jgi:hypothetical protein